jgi:uncharacterized membrane protein
VELSGTLFSSTFLWWAGGIYALSLISAIRMAPWGRLFDREQLHVFLGTCVALMLLWHMRAEFHPGLVFHLLGVTTVTLMFGWSLGVIGTSLALAGVTLNLGMGWDSFLVNALTNCLVPVTLTQILLVLIRSLLPKNFFIFVLGNAFVTAGLVGVITGYLTVWLLVSNGAYSLLVLKQTFMPFFPLMFLPEAIINGWITTILVSLRPQWVRAFSDELYLKGK